MILSLEEVRKGLGRNLKKPFWDFLFTVHVTINQPNGVYKINKAMFENCLSSGFFYFYFFIFSKLMNAVRSIIAGTPEQEDKNCY